MYLQLFLDKLVICIDKNSKNERYGELTWTDCVSIMSDFEFIRRAQKPTSYVDKMKREIAGWVKNEWGLHARVISRSGKKAQDSFENNGWGPNNFYTTLNQRKNYDLTILLYFEVGEIYKILAYPMGLIDEIKWRSKDKGPNLQKVMIFDPRELNGKFVFSTFGEFKDEYLERMA